MKYHWMGADTAAMNFIIQVCVYSHHIIEESKVSNIKTALKSVEFKMCPRSLIWKKDENQLIEVRFHILLSLEQSLHQDIF